MRPGVTGADVPLRPSMVCTTAEFCGSAEPDLWERYLQVLDGLRARDGQAALCAPPLCDAALAEAMARLPAGGPRPAGRRPGS